VDLWLAQERARLEKEETQIQSERAQISRRRLEAGDISELTASATHVELLRAMERTRGAVKDVTILRGRLQLLLGLVSNDSTFEILSPEVGAESVAPIDSLLDTAMAARPDLRAAELAIEAAGERLGWEQSNILDFILWIDGKDKGQSDLEIGPGFAVDIPILNQNNGRIARAKAELEAAARQYEVTRQTIILEVHEAHTEYASARADYDFWRGDVIGVLEAANRQAERSFAAGDVSYLRVLDAKTKVIEAQLHEAELTAGLQRSVAQLNYCVGRRMTGVRSPATVAQRRMVP
jgi:outer membrane protein, heavy metal efflux system